MQNVMIWAFVIFIWVSSTVVFIVMIILCIVFVYILCTVYIVAVLVFGFVCVGVCGQRLALRSSAPALDCGWLPRRTWRWSAHSLLHLKYAASQRFSSSCCLGFASSCFLPVSMCFEFLTLAHQLCQHPATAHSHLSVLHSSPPQLSLQPLQSHQLFSLISPLHHLSLPWTLQYFNIKYTVTQIVIPPNRFGVCILPFAFLS